MYTVFFCIYVNFYSLIMYILTPEAKNILLYKGSQKNRHCEADYFPCFQAQATHLLQREADIKNDSGFT